MNQKISLKKGFTLIEMIVALGIFTVVALVAVGALVRITDANKKSITLKTTINNLNFALESISREMRVGGDYYCTSGSGQNFTNPDAFIQNTSNSCPNGITTNEQNSSQGWTIAFHSSIKSGTAPDDCNLIYAYSYFPNEKTIKKAEQPACHQSVTDYNELISKDIVITDTIVNVNVASDRQPKVFLWLKGYSGVRIKERTEFEVQTTVSQRISSN